MKRLWLILFVIFSLNPSVFGQDVYPYFNDPLKQLDFEKQRIYINEVSEERQYISGGEDRLNLWSLIIEDEPKYRKAPITTSFYYNYKFEIVQNGNQLSEVEFLRIIGLNDMAEKVLSQYRLEVETWMINPPHTPTSTTNSNQKLFYRIAGYGFTGVGGFLGITGLIFPAPPLLYLTAAGSLWLGFKCLSMGKVEGPYEEPKPILKQSLTNEQIKSLAESYNRRIYTEIANLQ
jgi:hypothetical protein